MQLYGEAPGRYMSTVREGEPCLAVARIDLGNVVLLPQPMAAVGDDAFASYTAPKPLRPTPTSAPTSGRNTASEPTR